jgi:hypothetical protein
LYFQPEIPMRIAPGLAIHFPAVAVLVAVETYCYGSSKFW